MQINDAVFYVEGGPEFEVRDGLFHVIHKLGGCRLELVLPPHAFSRAVRKAELALAKFERDSGANIVRLQAHG